MIKKEMIDNMMVVNGCVFFTGKSKKFDRDLYRAVELLEKETLTVVERIELLHIYQASYHESGKIERVNSYDSSATNCRFCKAMREKAKNNPAHICNLCYDHAAEQYKINSLNRHSLNMLIMQTVAFTVDELRTVPAGMINRIDSAGDMPNSIYAENMVKIAIVNSNVRFAFWTKNTLALIAATDKLGKPENAVYIQSSEIIGRPATKAKYFDYVFTVYPDKESVKAAIENGAAECNGKKCLECGFKCYQGTHKAENIAELLRGVSAAKRDEIKAWLANN
jgi:hypothetical protein